MNFPDFFPPPPPSPISFWHFFHPPPSPHATPHTPSIWDLRVDYVSDNNYLLFVWLTPVTILSQKPLHNKCTVSKPYISDCLRCLLLINRVSVNPAKPWKRAIKNHYFFFHSLTFFLPFFSPNRITLTMRYFTQADKEQLKTLWKFSGTQIWDTDSTRHFDLNNRKLKTINKDNICLHLKTCKNHFVSSCCVTSVSVVAWLIRHFLFYNGHFSLRWLPLVTKVSSKSN